MNYKSRQFQPKPSTCSSKGLYKAPKIQTPEEKALVQAKTRKLNAEAAKDTAISVSIYRSTLPKPRKSQK
jgi:hypothetical protein